MIRNHSNEWEGGGGGGLIMLCPEVIRIKISIFLKISRKRWWVAIFFLKIWRGNVYQRSSCQLHLAGATWQNRLQVQYDDEAGTSVWHSKRARHSKGKVEGVNWGKGNAQLPRTFFLYSRTGNFLARPHPFEPPSRGLHLAGYIMKALRGSELSERLKKNRSKHLK